MMTKRIKFWKTGALGLSLALLAIGGSQLTGCSHSKDNEASPIVTDSQNGDPQANAAITDPAPDPSASPTDGASASSPDVSSASPDAATGAADTTVASTDSAGDSAGESTPHHKHHRHRDLSSTTPADSAAAPAPADVPPPPGDQAAGSAPGNPGSPMNMGNVAPPPAEAPPPAPPAPVVQAPPPPAQTVASLNGDGQTKHDGDAVPGSGDSLKDQIAAHKELLLAGVIGLVGTISLLVIRRAKVRS